jgi:SPFH domain / Band 7 family
VTLNPHGYLDTTTVEWGVEVTLVELKDIQLPDSMKRAMAREAEAEREKRAKIIAVEGEARAAAALGDASDTMMKHPLALQVRNLQTLAELGGREKHDRRLSRPIDERYRRTYRLPDPRVDRLTIRPAQRSTRRDAHPCRGPTLNAALAAGLLLH